MLKWMTNLVALAMLGAILAIPLVISRRAAEEESRIDQARVAVRRFEQVVKLRAETSPEFDTARRGYPAVIDPSWFENTPPRNPLLGPDNPWLEIAGPEQADLLHPMIRQAVDSSFAGLWYNPYQGVVRARVPIMINDEQALAIYNGVNGAQVTSLFDEEPERIAARIRQAKERLRATRAERAMDPTQPLSDAGDQPGSP